MASCGGPTLAKQRGIRKSSSLNYTSLGTQRSWVACTAVGLTSVILLAGCMSIRYGSPPRTDRLATLTTGVSSAGDVLLALGEPRGRGVVRQSVDLPPRTIWSYEYMEAEGSQIGLKILFVYFDQDRYDGYLWFSSTALLDKTQ
jgi:hypothetical protein